MKCELIHLLFADNDSNYFSNKRDAQIKAIFKLGYMKGISFDFLIKLCDHPERPGLIFWHNIPLIRIHCLGTQCDIEILHNKKEIILYLLQHVIQHPEIRYITILADLRLPGWKNYYEFILILNRVGKLLLISTKMNLSNKDLNKLKRHWNIQIQNIISLENDIDVLDILSHMSFFKSDFRILI